MDGKVTLEVTAPDYDEHLKLCGHYVNRAYANNILIFIPISLLLGNMYFFMDIINIDAEVAENAQLFLWGSLAHVIFTAFYDIQKQ